MDITDLSDTIVPRSDQLNADDLIAGPRVLTVRGVRRGTDDQPLVIDVGDDRPYKPCKSMRRVLIAAWGSDGRQWAGRSMEVYNDPAVTWGGKAVGGIRIRALSHIDRPMSVALTVKRGKRTPYSVSVLEARQPAPAPVDKGVAREALDNALRAHSLTIADLDGWAASVGKPDSTTMEARQMAALSEMISSGTERGQGIVGKIVAWAAGEE